jgi:hypothetical protein
MTATAASTPGRLQAAAIGYAQRGIPVLPLHYPVAVPSANPGPGPGPVAWSTRCSCRRGGCDAIGKHPLGDLVPAGVHDATTDPARITAWWTAQPAANIGLATGHLFDALDVDGPDGIAAIRAFANEHGLAAEHGLASTGPLVRTGSGGWHYWLAPTGLGNRDPRGFDHVDWRGLGGYVVAPPSTHASGQPYRFVRDLSHPIPPVQAALRERLDPQRATASRPALPTQPPRLGHPYGLQAGPRVRAAGRARPRQQAAQHDALPGRAAAALPGRRRRSGRGRGQRPAARGRATLRAGRPGSGAHHRQRPRHRDQAPPQRARPTAGQPAHHDLPPSATKPPSTRGPRWATGG